MDLGSTKESGRYRNLHCEIDQDPVPQLKYPHATREAVVEYIAGRLSLPHTALAKTRWQHCTTIVTNKMQYRI